MSSTLAGLNWLPLVVLIVVVVGTTNAKCPDHQLCVRAQRCRESDDSGIGKIGPRISLPCGTGLVCCDKAQLESYEAQLAAREDAAEKAEKKGIPNIRSTNFIVDKNDDGNNNGNTTQYYKSCGLNMECVPRWLCRGTIIDDGRYLIGPRLGDKCLHMQTCCLINNKLDERVNNAETEKFTYDKCGQSNPKGVLINMENYKEEVARFGEFPWMVALFIGRNSYLCGGTLIHPSLVLTSAHNVENQTTETLLARAGEWDMSSVDEPLAFQMRRIKQIIVHSDFDREAFFNDIALLVLETPFELAPHIQPLCLPPPESPQELANLRSARCIATGWGGKKPTDTEPGHLLKRIDLPIVSHDECQAKLRLTRLGLRFRLRDSFLCAGGIEGRDTCKGDGGSPLFCTLPDSTDRYKLVGIVSWGIECAEDDVPAAYANVPYLRKWIDEKTTALGY